MWNIISSNHILENITKNKLTDIHFKNLFEIKNRKIKITYNKTLNSSNNNKIDYKKKKITTENKILKHKINEINSKNGAFHPKILIKKKHNTYINNNKYKDYIKNKTISEENKIMKNKRKELKSNYGFKSCLKDILLYKKIKQKLSSIVNKRIKSAAITSSYYNKYNNITVTNKTTKRNNTTVINNHKHIFNTSFFN